MGWVRLDDQFPDHPKIDQAGPLAGWLYVCGLAYCNRQLTDGFIPASTMPRLSSVARPGQQAAALVAAGLWDEVDGGWKVHDYLLFQPSREKVLHERELAAKRQASRRKSRRDIGVSHGGSSAAPTQPNPKQVTVDPSLTPVPDPDRDALSRIRAQERGSPDAARRALAVIRGERGTDADEAVTL